MCSYMYMYVHKYTVYAQLIHILLEKRVLYMYHWVLYSTPMDILC